MFESNFKYTQELLNKISKNSTKRTNLIGEILMIIILVGVVILFVTGNKLLGGIFAGILVLFVISLIFANKIIKNSNMALLGHEINIVFNQDKMTMIANFAGETLYNMSFDYKAIKKVVYYPGLVYVYFDKKSAIIVPKYSFTTTENYEKAIQLINDNYLV